MTESTSARRTRRLLTLGVIATSPLVVVVAGHGAVPVGYLMIRGWGVWTLPDLLAWLAVVLLAVGGIIAPEGSTGRRLRARGGIASIASWAIFSRGSELRWLTMASSVPYLAALAAWDGKILGRRLRRGSSARASASR